VAQHSPAGQLGQQPVDGLVEREPSVLDQLQRGYGRNRPGHRRDAEDSVGPDRLAAVG